MALRYRPSPVSVAHTGVCPRLTASTLLALCALLATSAAHSQLTPGSLDVHWDEGSSNCANDLTPPLQVHSYNARTFILRENLCATFEANFIYLLLGSTKALLIDTGDVADPNRMPLAKTVMDLLPGEGSAKLPLLVAHTHRHLDHRAGDGQFTHLANVEVIGFDIDSVRRYYHFNDWPNDLTHIDLGGRIVDGIPTPGHNETEVSFYDQNTGLFFAGDFLMPGRLLVDDANADLASAQRVAAFVQDRPVTFVLGGHIEMDADRKLFPWGSQHHPHEHALEMTKADLLALPAAVRSFNGFYTKSGKFVLINSTHNLIALAIVVGLLVLVLALGLARHIWRRKRARKMLAKAETTKVSPGNSA